MNQATKNSNAKKSKLRVTRRQWVEIATKEARISPDLRNAARMEQAEIMIKKIDLMIAAA